MGDEEARMLEGEGEKTMNTTESPRLEEMRDELEELRDVMRTQGGDFEGMPPREARRAMKEYTARAMRETRLARAVSIAEDLDAHGLPWTRRGDWIHFMLADGTTKAVIGEETPEFDRSGQIRRQIEAIGVAETSHDARRDLTLLDLDVGGSRELKWVRGRLHGVSVPRFAKGFMVDAGLLEDGENGMGATRSAVDHGLLVEHEGEFGPKVAATALGIAWIYRAYLAGRVPLTKGDQRPNVATQYELEAIADAQAVALAELPDGLRSWMHAGSEGEER
jgi:hypothetical protein